MTQAATHKLNSIQLLRALAACLVVFGHCMGFVADFSEQQGFAFSKIPMPGGAGVDLFFAISGFIMVVASTRMFGQPRGSRDFLLRRIARIVPLYWAVTTLAVMLIIAGGRRVLPEPLAIAASYFFVPFDTTGRSDGFAFPIVDLGWTLNYEMLFYAVFALFIGFGRTRCVQYVTAAIALMVGLGMLFEPAQIAMRFWSQAIMLEFVFGMWIGLAYASGRLQLSVGVRTSLLLIAVLFLAINPLPPLHSATTPNDIYRVIGWGLPTAGLLMAAVSGPWPGYGWAERALVLIGDSSYSLYLLHPFWLLVVSRSVVYFPRPVQEPLPLMAIAFLGAIFTSLLVYLLAEKPLTTFLNARIKRLNRNAPPVCSFREA